MKAAQGWVVVAMLMGGGWLQGQEAPEAKAPDKYTVKSGTRIPLVLVNSISTKTSREGDRVYLQTAFPIFTDGRIVIPEGSYVTGTITEVKRPGRIKGRGEMYLRFDTLMLRNGVQRDFRGRRRRRNFEGRRRADPGRQHQRKGRRDGGRHRGHGGQHRGHCRQFRRQRREGSGDWGRSRQRGRRGGGTADAGSRRAPAAGKLTGNATRPRPGLLP